MVFLDKTLGQNATYEPTSTYFLNHLPCTFLVFLILVHYVHCHLPSERFPSVSSINCACGPFSLSKPFESFESLKSLAHLIWQVKVASPAIGVKTHSMELWPVCTGDFIHFWLRPSCFSPKQRRHADRYIIYSTSICK